MKPELEDRIDFAVGRIDEGFKQMYKSLGNIEAELETIREAIVDIQKRV